MTSKHAFVSTFIGLSMVFGLATAQSGPVMPATTDSIATPVPEGAGVEVPDSVDVPTAAPVARENRGSRVIEEIIVTAQKREENLNDVPISVAAFSGDKLEALGIQDTKQLPQITPGMQFDSVVGFNLIFIRGVGTEVFVPGTETSVATYVDGVYLPYNGLTQEFGKVERVEVLKGPQGTLFGRNVTGGAINIINQKPSRDYSGTGSLEYGSFNTRKAKAYITGPLGENVQASLSAVDGAGDTYYKRIEGSTFAPYPKDLEYGVQLKVNWDITDDVSLTATGLTSRQKGLGGAIFTSTKVKPEFQAVIPSYSQPYTSNPDSPSYFRAQSYLEYTELHWNTPSFFDLRVFGSHQQVDTGLSIDFEGSSAPLVTFIPKNTGGKYTSAEVQFTSNENGWEPDRFKWVAGYYYFHSYNAGFRHLTLDVAESLFDGSIGPTLSSLNSLANELQNGLTALGLPPLGAGVPNAVSVHLTGLIAGVSNAVYGQGTYDLTDRFAVTLGARLSEEKKTLTESTLGIEYANDQFSPPLISYPKESQTASDISPKVTLDYKIIEGSLLYASFQQGFKSGTFNTVNVTKSPAAVKPEKLTAYEAGLKGTLFDKTLQYSTAVFQYTIEKPQQLYVSLQSSGALSIENAGKSRIRGLDADLTWQPLPDALPGLVLTASGALLRGKFLSYQHASGFNQAGIFVSNLDFTGNSTTRTPRYSFDTGINYRFDMGSANVETGLNVYRNGGYYFNAGNTIKQDPYTLLNAQIAYTYQPWGMRVSLIGQNLTKSVYLANAFETDFNTVINYASPRTIFANIQFLF